MCSTRYIAPTGPVTNRILPGDAVLLCAHGGKRRGFALEALTSRLRWKLPDCRVESCNLYGPPSIEQTVEKMEERRLVCVPFLMADGLTYEVLAGRVGALAGLREILLVKPIGLHPRLPDLVGRALESRRQTLGWLPQRTAVLLIGHGTRRNNASRNAVERLGEGIKRKARFQDISSAYLEEDPAIANALFKIKADRILAVGCFADAGAHAAVDVPGELEKETRPVSYLGLLGALPLIDDLLISDHFVAAHYLPHRQFGSGIKEGLHVAR